MEHVEFRKRVETLKWTIPSLTAKHQVPIRSPTFAVRNDFRLHFDLWPKGNDRYPGDGDCLALYLTATKASTAARFKFFILNNRHQMLVTRTAAHWMTIDPVTVASRTAVGCRRFASRSDLFVKDHGWLVNDALTIVCRLEYVNIRSQVDGCSPLLEKPSSNVHLGTVLIVR